MKWIKCIWGSSRKRCRGWRPMENIWRTVYPDISAWSSSISPSPSSCRSSPASAGSDRHCSRWRLSLHWWSWCSGSLWNWVVKTLFLSWLVTTSVLRSETRPWRTLLSRTRWRRCRSPWTGPDRSPCPWTGSRWRDWCRPGAVWPAVTSCPALSGENESHMEKIFQWS